MAINNFYSGDLAAITQGEIGAQDADTRAKDAAYRYLLGLAMNRTAYDRNNVERQRINADQGMAFDTNQTRRYGFDVGRDVSREGFGVDRDRIAANREIANMQNATRLKLGEGELALGGRQVDANTKIAEGAQGVTRYGIDVSADNQLFQNLFGMDLNDRNNAAADARLAKELESRLAVARLGGESALAQIKAQGAIMQPNPRLSEAVLEMQMENMNSNSLANAAAARANAMIPAAADEIGTIPFFGTSESQYNASVRPGGDPAARARLLSRVMKNLDPASAALVMPSDTGFVPVIRGGTNNPTAGPALTSALKRPIDVDREVLSKTIQKAQLYPADTATKVINEATKAFTDKWGEAP